MPRDHSDPPTYSSPSGEGGARQGDEGGQTPNPTYSSPSGGGGARQGDGGGQAPNAPQTAHQPPQSRPIPDSFRSALLLGEDHTELGEVALREVTPNLVIGISRGRFPKGYAHVDPNEDAAFAGTDGATTILAVADGHHGFDAARTAMSAIAGATTEAIVDSLEAIVRRLAAAATTAVSKAVPPLSPPRDTSRTSLTIAVIRDNAVAATTIGDTAGFVATRRRPKRLGNDTEFLSAGSDPASVEIAQMKLPNRAAVVLITDGFFEFATTPRATLRSAPQLAAPDAAKLLVSESFSGGAGDNIAVAVFQQP